MIQAKKRWAVAVGYVCLIYATLSVVGRPLRFLRDHNALRLSLAALYATCAASILFLFARRRITQVWRYAALLGLFGLYLLSAQLVQTPEEELHFLEYGLVGVFFLRPLADAYDWSWRTYGKAFLLATAAGWIDELLQGLLPNRHYDMRDVGLNALSILLGLAVYALYRTRQKAGGDKLTAEIERGVRQSK